MIGSRIESITKEAECVTAERQVLPKQDVLTAEERTFVNYWSSHPCLNDKFITMDGRNQRVDPDELSRWDNRRKLRELLYLIGLKYAEEHVDWYLSYCEMGWHLVDINGEERNRAYKNLFEFVGTSVEGLTGGEKPWWVLEQRRRNR